MTKKISNFEIFCITYFLIRASFFNFTLNNIQQNTEISTFLIIIIGSILGLIPLYIFITIINHKDSVPVKELINSSFSKLGSKIINTILFIFTILFIAILFSNLNLYIKETYLEKMNPLFISIGMFIPVIYLSLKKKTTLGRSSIILFLISILFTLISIFSLLFKINFSNILLLKINKSTFNNLILYVGYNILPLFYIIDLVKKDKDSIKYILLSYIFTTTLLVIISLLMSNSNANKKILDILEQVSIIGYSGNIGAVLTIQSILDLFITISTSLFFLRSYTGKKYLLIVLLIIFVLSNLLFNVDIALKYIMISLYIILLFIPIIIYFKIKSTKH